MKQKKCPQCKNLISVLAPTCLYCGRPNKFVTNAYVKSKWEKELNKNKPNIFKIILFKYSLIIFFVILIILLLSRYR